MLATGELERAKLPDHSLPPRGMALDSETPGQDEETRMISDRVFDDMRSGNGGGEEHEDQDEDRGRY